ncbi:MAG: hypothetical protein ABIY55_30910 [Kofleriaceae bacterium]
MSYTNRKGQVYYLHAGRTKTGKRRYFVAKTIGAGALAALPAGFEIVESVNAVVSVRRVDPNARKIPETDLARVRAELAKHPRLRRYRADVVKGDIIVFEPIGGLSDELARHLTTSFQLPPFQLEQRRPELEKGTHYSPVLRFTLIDREYAVCRMTYRGDGGWSWALAHGSLGSIAAKYVKSLGTPAFFQLY